MKHLFTLLFLTISFQSFAIEKYTKNDTLYIITPSGLNLRNAPSSNSEVIGKLKFGDPVISLFTKTLSDYKNNSITITDSYPYGKVTLKGSWVKVKFGQQEGYIFDAFTSLLPITKFNGYPYGLKPLLSKILYLKEEFIHIKNFKKPNSYTKSSVLKNHNYLFSNGITLHEKEKTNESYYGGFKDYTVTSFSIEQKITFKETSYEEVFLMILNASHIIYNDYDEGFSKFKYDNDKLILSFDAFGSYTIEEEGDSIIVIFNSNSGPQC